MVPGGGKVDGGLRDGDLQISLAVRCQFVILKNAHDNRLRASKKAVGICWTSLINGLQESLRECLESAQGGSVLLLKSLLAWLVILCLAVANGALREDVLIPSLGRSTGLILSGVLLSVVVVLVAYAIVRLSQNITVAQGLLVGGLWLCLTLAFEFSFGRYYLHKSWAELLDAYKFKDGNLWPAVLLVTFLAPCVAILFRSVSSHAKRGA